jgi:predicted outer membrane repeat protein
MWKPLLLPALLLAALASAGPVRAANFDVNVSRDGVDEDGALPCDIGGKWVDDTPNIPFDSERPCSLRAAIQLANLTEGPDNIGIDLNDTVSNNVSKLRLTLKGAGEDDGLTGDLDVHGQINIGGEGNSGSRQLFISGGGDRIFDIHPGGILDLRRATLQKGKTSKSDAEPSGGCIRSAGTFTSGSLFLFSCSSVGDGGAMSVTDGTATLENTVFSTSKAMGEGGGLLVGPDGEVTLDKVTFGRNSAGTGGGAIATRGDLTLRNTTVDRNTSKLGAGGIAVLGAGTTFIRMTTISENGAVNLDATGNTGTLSIGGSILWGAETNDCVGVPTDGVSFGGNLEGAESCHFSRQNVDPLLAPLNNYGGLVPTRALAADSPAIDRGLDDILCARDARNRPRLRTLTVNGPSMSDSGAVDFDDQQPFVVEITSTAPTDPVSVGEEFVYDVQATGPRPQCITFSIGSNLQPGMEIDSATGVITWTPTAPGTFANIRVDAADGGNDTGSQRFTIVVE